MGDVLDRRKLFAMRRAHNNMKQRIADREEVLRGLLELATPKYDLSAVAEAMREASRYAGDEDHRLDNLDE